MLRSVRPVVRTSSQDEETSVTLTSLRRCNITTEQVLELYRMSWRIEATYKAIESRFCYTRERTIPCSHRIRRCTLSATKTWSSP